MSSFLTLNNCLETVRSAPCISVADTVMGFINQQDLTTDLSQQNTRQILSQIVLAIALPAITTLGVSYNTIAGTVRLGTGCLSLFKEMPRQEILQEFGGAIVHYLTAVYDSVLGNLLWLRQIFCLIVAGLKSLSNFLIDNQKQ